MKINFLGVLLLTLAVVFCGSVFAGGGVALQPPDWGFEWPQWVISLGGYLGPLTSVVGSFALLAAITPNKYDNIVARVLRAIVDFLGANFYKAKNERQ